MTEQTIRYSIVIPVLNEQESIATLYTRLKETMDNVEGACEILFVDDGSTDDTFALLRELASIDPRVAVVRLRRNYGKTAALAAGFDAARGECIITLDGDLQHDPADIPRFLAKLDEGYDIVCSWRVRRVDNFWMRRIPSRIANWVMARLSGVRIHDFGGGFKAYRREVLEHIPIYGEMQRFIPALASSVGASICEVPIQNIPREHGSSHYGIGRAIPVFFDLITIRFLLKYAQRPLHFFGIVGMLGLFAGLATALGLMVDKFLFGHDILANHAPLMMFAAVLIIAGVQLLALGLLGEMQVRHFHSPQGSAPYKVASILRADQNARIPE